MHPQRRAGETPQDRAGAPRVIHVDVSDDHVGEIARIEPEAIERLGERRHVGARTRLDESGLPGGDHVRGVERLEASGSDVDDGDVGGGVGERGRPVRSVLAHGRQSRTGSRTRACVVGPCRRLDVRSSRTKEEIGW